MGTAKGSKPWNAGTSKGWVDKRGYRWLYVSYNGKRVARREHRVVMETHLGRDLEPWELVHHKDGDKLNNNVDNLELREFGEHTAEHHTGSRKSEDARRSMEAFALMRETLRRLRSCNSDLLAAVTELLQPLESAASELQAHGRVLDEYSQAALDRARAAIAKATGEPA